LEMSSNAILKSWRDRRGFEIDTCVDACVLAWFYKVGMARSRRAELR
jgi:hypothetical protein